MVPPYRARKIHNRHSRDYRQLVDSTDGTIKHYADSIHEDQMSDKTQICIPNHSHCACVQQAIADLKSAWEDDGTGIAGVGMKAAIAIPWAGKTLKDNDTRRKVESGECNPTQEQRREYKRLLDILQRAEKRAPAWRDGVVEALGKEC